MSEAVSPVPAPEANPDLIGQDKAESVLLDAYNSGRLPHAWLITGPRGTGKATLAFRFARFVLSGGGTAEEGDSLFGDELPSATGMGLSPDHPVFRQVAGGAHPDLMVLRRSENEKTKKLRQEIVIDDVRKVTNFLRMTSTAGGWRVVIVDTADDLNRNSANGLLKVLEEPPEDALLILISNAPGALLPTIRSRCCQLPIVALSVPELEGLLEKYLPDSGQEERRALAVLSEGAAGRALELAEGGGLEIYREMLTLLDSLPRVETARLHAFGELIGRDNTGTAFRLGGELLSGWIARGLEARARGVTPVDVFEGEAAIRERLLSRGNLEQWLTVWENLTALFQRTERANLDKKQAVIAAFLDLERLAA